MRTAIYVRISQDKEGAGLGVARQEGDCRRQVCQPRGWDDATVYVDNDLSAYSGKRRPEYERMLNDARDGKLDAIVAWHTDRLHRSPSELETFIEVVESRAITIETVRAGLLDLATPSGRLVARQLGAVARYESEHKADRQRLKHAELAQAGKVGGGGHRPFGYQPDRVTILEAEAIVLRDLVERLLAGESLVGLCVSLNERGVTTTTGRAWQPTPLRRLLASPRICGLRQHQGKIVGDAQWEAIITPEQGARARALLNDPARMTRRAPRSYPLKGLLRCGLCRQPLVGRPRDDGARRYICAKPPRFAGCGKILALAEPLELYALEAMLEALDTPRLAVAIRGRQRADDTNGWQAKIDEFNGRLEELAKAYAAGAIGMREWLAARGPLQEGLDDASRRAVRESSVATIAEYVGRAGLLRERWPGMAIDKQNAIFRGMLVEIIVNPGRRGYNRFDPDRFEPIWRH